MDKYNAAMAAYYNGKIDGHKEAYNNILTKITTVSINHHSDFCVLCGEPATFLNLCDSCRNELFNKI